MHRTSEKVERGSLLSLLNLNLNLNLTLDLNLHLMLMRTLKTWCHWALAAYARSECPEPLDMMPQSFGLVD